MEYMEKAEEWNEIEMQRNSERERKTIRRILPGTVMVTLECYYVQQNEGELTYINVT